jgi:hypothetical protein
MTEPTPSGCGHCDFMTGRRGMDRCRWCDGTGSVFRVKGRIYQNTKEGYEAAVAALAEVTS